MIVLGDAAGTVRLLDGATGRQCSKPLRGHVGRITSVMLAGLADGPVIISGGKDGTIRVWDLRRSSYLFYRVSSIQRETPLRGHEGPVTSVALGSFNSQPAIISGGEDGTIRLWDLASGTERGRPLRGHSRPVTSVVVGTFADREMVISGGQDGTVRIWNLDGSEMSRVHVGCNIRALAFLEPQAVVAAAVQGLLLLQF